MDEQFRSKPKRICGFSANIGFNANIDNESLIGKALEKRYIDDLKKATIIFIRLSDIQKENLINRVRQKHANIKKNNYLMDPAEWHWISLYYSGYWILEDRKN